MRKGDIGGERRDRINRNLRRVAKNGYRGNGQNRGM
jgi:hypothetical protein